MKSSRGFTLIEVLAAVAVLAIALAAIMSSMARYADSAGYLRQKTVALWVAHNRLTEIELDPKWPAIGNSDCTTDLAGATWKWTVEVKVTPDARLRRVDITVKSPDHDASLIQISSFISNSGRS